MKTGSLKRLLGYTFRYKWSFFISVIGFISFAFADIAAVEWIRRIIGFINSEEENFNSFLALSLILIALGRGVGFFIGNYFMSRVGFGIVHDLRAELFQKLHDLPKSYFDANQSGQLINRITFTTTQVSGAASNAVKTLIREGFLWAILKEPYWCAVIAFALNTGAYTSEILRSAFQTIKLGYIEAGKSLGIPNKIIFYKIQVPIAIRQSLPAYGNEIILMLKGTSLASTVTLMDLTGVAKYIISTTFRPVEVFIVAGGIYLFMTFIIHNVIKFLEKKYSFNS